MSRARFSLLTWNVWFGEYAFARRNEYILNLIERQSVDIICLQEVTHEFLSILAQRSRLVADYDISDNDLSGATIGSYGVLMMCKKELQASYHFTEFPTGMGRSLLSAELALDGQHSNVGGTFCVGTVHLESLDSARLRIKQGTWPL
jgi:endonuclease/exonuclease/phosphatase family metal-dependent hydrolase